MAGVLNLCLVLSIAFSAILPTSSYSSKESTSENQVVILDSRGYRNFVGYYQVDGEIQNRGSNIIAQGELSASFYDKDGSLLANAIAPSELNVLGPGETSGFSVILSEKEISSRITLYEVDFDYNDSAGIVNKPQKLVLVHGGQYVDEYGSYHLTGEVLNLGSYATRFARVSASFYDSEGRTLFSRYAYALADPIPTMASSPYHIIVEDRDNLDIKTFSARVQSAEYTMLAADSSVNPGPNSKAEALSIHSDAIGGNASEQGMESTSYWLSGDREIYNLNGWRTMQVERTDDSGPMNNSRPAIAAYASDSILTDYGFNGFSDSRMFRIDYRYEVWMSGVDRGGYVILEVPKSLISEVRAVEVYGVRCQVPGGTTYHRIAEDAGTTVIALELSGSPCDSAPNEHDLMIKVIDKESKFDEPLNFVVFPLVALLFGVPGIIYYLKRRRRKQRP